MVEEKKMKEIEESDEHRLYKLRKGTRGWRESGRTFGALLMFMGVALFVGTLAIGWAVNAYPPDTTDHYIATGELNKTSAAIIDRLMEYDGSNQIILTTILIGTFTAMGGMFLFFAVPDKKDIQIFDDALELYQTGKMDHRCPKFCPECGMDLKRKD